MHEKCDAKRCNDSVVRRHADVLPQKYQRIKMTKAVGPEEAKEIMDTFRNTFHHGKWPRKTYAICEFPAVSWIRYKSVGTHAEVSFINDMRQKKIGRTPVKIKFWINWTPCSSCATKLIQWVTECQGNVQLEIICVGFYFVPRHSRTLSRAPRIKETYQDVDRAKRKKHDKNLSGLQKLIQARPKKIILRMFQRGDLWDLSVLVTGSQSWWKTLSEKDMNNIEADCVDLDKDLQYIKGTVVTGNQLTSI